MRVHRNEHLRWLAQCAASDDVAPHTRKKILDHAVDKVPNDLANYTTYLNGLRPDEPPLVAASRKLVIVELQAVLLTTGEYTWGDIKDAKKDDLIQMIYDTFQQQEDLRDHIIQHRISRTTADDIVKAHKPTRATRHATPVTQTLDTLPEQQLRQLEAEHQRTQDLRALALLQQIVLLSEAYGFAEETEDDDTTAEEQLR